MSETNTKRMSIDSAAIGARARDVAAKAIPLGKQAGNTAVEGVRQGVQSARGWAAPRIDNAADAVTTSVAPAVSTALRATARQVNPEPPATGKRGLGALLSLRGLLATVGVLAAISAAAAAAAAAMRRRYQSATAEAEEESGEQSGTTPEATAQSDVNGRVPSGGL